MAKTNLPEVWLRGPIEDVPALLQPVAHALLQAREEVNSLMVNFPVSKLWDRPAGVASVAFHLQHITGVLDRLFTYAAGNQLSEEQLQYLSSEGKFAPQVSVEELVENLNQQIETVINRLKQISPDILPEVREVGRKKLPSTVIGLIFHAAEHTMRHVGQLLVTVQILTR